MTTITVYLGPGSVRTVSLHGIEWDGIWLLGLNLLQNELYIAVTFTDTGWRYYFNNGVFLMLLNTMAI